MAPMMLNGQPVLELNTNGHTSYMGLNGTTTNGNLMVQIRDLDAMEAESSLRPPESPVLPRDTSLTAFPNLVPPDFTHGIEILNDSTTPMQFVTSVLSSCAGLSPEDSHRTMLDIHTRGGALLPTPSLAEAQRIAAQITAESAKSHYPLVCRPVSIEPRA